MYEEFFGLTDVPFRLTPDPHFLYLSPKHAEALAHLRLGLTEPGGFVCITGEIGTGKTTVLRTFLADLGPDVPIAFIFNPTLSWENMLVRIARDLGVPVDQTRDADLMDALNARLLETRRDGRTAVVVIDEAQAIPPDVLERLRLLSNLETSTEKLIRLVLVGQPQLARVLLDPELAQLNQRITLRWHLRPLTRAETFAYVRHRLAVAGGAHAAGLFTRPALWRLHRYSGGVPRLVNMIAHRALLAAYVRRRRRVGARAVRRAYREIRTVPLAKGGRRWRLDWALGLLAVVLAVATLRLPEFRRRLADLRSEALLAMALDRPATPAVEVPPAVDAAPVVDAAPAVPAVAAPAAATPASVAAPLAATASPPDDVEAFETRLVQLGSDGSMRAAVETVLTRWNAQSLLPDEGAGAASLGSVAHRRRLEIMKLTGNLSMLRLLDLPAVLTLHLPGMRSAAYAALVGVDDAGATVALGDERTHVSPERLGRVWFGEAWVVWRDFEWLGPTFGRDDQGEHVARLQRLLARAGFYDGPATGWFGEATESAVLRFQRSRRLDADSRVGRLTRITLYAASGQYDMPTLSAGTAREIPTTTATAGDGVQGAS